MDIMIGANPLSWMNSDFPHLGREISVERCLFEISEIGYRGVEIEEPFLRLIDRLPEMLSKRELTCIGKWHSTFILEEDFEKEKERLCEHIAMLQRLGAEVVILAECSFAVHRNKDTALSKRPKIMDVKDRVKLCRGLDTMARIIKESGLKSAYHHHMGTCVQDEEDIDFLLNNTEELGLLFDSGHLAFAGVDPVRILQKHISRISHVHLKSVRQRVLAQKIREDSSFYSAVIDGVFTVPGDNDGESEDPIPFKDIARVLIDAAYRGWVVMEAEQNPEKADPYAYAQTGYRTIKSLFGG